MIFLRSAASFLLFVISINSYSLSCSTYQGYIFPRGGHLTEEVYPDFYETYSCPYSTLGSCEIHYGLPALKAAIGITDCYRISQGWHNCGGYEFFIRVNTTQCFEEAEQADQCDKYSGNKSQFLASQTADKICTDSCVAKKISSSNPVLGGHTSSSSDKNIYAMTNEYCFDGGGLPQHNDAFAETGAGESCTVIDGYRMCNTPDIDGDGIPEVPTPPEVPEGCMSITNIATTETAIHCSEYASDDLDNHPDEVCGFVGLYYECFKKDQCTFKDGSPVCIDSDGDYVATDSADNPMNGGNLDGDNSNDILGANDSITAPLLDQSDLANSTNQANNIGENLIPHLQNINDSINNNGTKLDQANGTLGAIASSITNVDNSISDLTETGTLTSTDYVTGTEFDSLDFVSFDADPNATTGFGDTLDDSLNIDNTLENVFNTGASCSDLSISFSDVQIFSMTCAQMARIKTILQWFLYVLLIIHAFNVMLKPQAK